MLKYIHLSKALGREHEPGKVEEHWSVGQYEKLKCKPLLDCLEWTVKKEIHEEHEEKLSF